MFGYVRPSDGHLTAEDKQRFQAAYCGLCRSLGRRYGLAARMILNYDLAFLAMLLSREPECPTAHCRCPAHPIRGCDALEPQPAFDAAADLSVILTWWQLKDGVADHGFFRRCWPGHQRRSRTRCAAGCWSSCCTTWAAGSIWWTRRTI